MNKIIIGRGPQTYVARYEGPHAEEVKGLFGTDILPTPYGLGMNVDFVVGRVADANPGVTVEKAA